MKNLRHSLPTGSIIPAGRQGLSVNWIILFIPRCFYFVIYGTTRVNLIPQEIKPLIQTEANKLFRSSNGELIKTTKTTTTTLPHSLHPFCYMMIILEKWTHFVVELRPGLLFLPQTHALEFAHAQCDRGIII